MVPIKKTNTAADSVDIAIFVKFDNKRPGNITEQMLCLQLPNGTFKNFFIKHR